MLPGMTGKVNEILEKNQDFFEKKQRISLTFPKEYDILSSPVKRALFLCAFSAADGDLHPAKSFIAAVIQGGK